ncbi:hypothetical protein BDV96DRAFT_548808 [Lophiotrema nucula]|uniref:ATP-dependent DNA ligase family profile domain-containing protein n=1 Tax=Lophiotrema nucula TaxID=690887 RepID=A0A6A5Z451_9PLEO|nr:hypothetical protein BDV96DRAFT_548808 [Lophiotrema nucula]
MTNWFKNQRSTLDHDATNGGIVLSTLLPHRRKNRVYGFGETSLAKKLTTLLNFNNGQRALFERWKDGKSGDLGKCTASAFKAWDGTFKRKHGVSIESVDYLLVQLAGKCRFSDPAVRQQQDWHARTDTLLKDTFAKLESFEAKWLVRLLLRNYCTIDFDERFLLHQYHFLLPDLLLFQNDFEVAFGLLRGELRDYPPNPDPESERTMRIEAGKQLRATVGVKVGRPAFQKAWSIKHCLQLVGNRSWAAEVKYDGEYCEMHIDLQKPSEMIQIFSKNGKDATADRRSLHNAIQASLRVGTPSCRFKKNCIVLGELVVWCDKQQKILPFSKIRKHVSRSGSFIGTLQDSLPHEWEHLMVVFFDVLVLDDEPILKRSLQARRNILKELVHFVPGRAMRSKWTLLDFRDEHGITDLRQAFARTIAERQEGLVLKPLQAPYFSLLSDVNSRQPAYFIKFKKDYLADMGGERDLGDFAVVGASYDPRVAAKTDLKPLHWTHFHLGCAINQKAVERTGERPKFKVVGAVSLDKAIPKPELKYLNVHGRLREVPLLPSRSAPDFDIEHPKSQGPRMAIAFKKPFVAEILGGGYEKLQDEVFEMLRHPRIKKIHHDRTWQDTVTMEDLEHMAQAKWEAPDAEKLDGHAKDIANLVGDTCTTNCTTECPGSTQTKGVQASKQIRVLVREDTAEKLNLPAGQLQPLREEPLPTPDSSNDRTPSASKRKLDLLSLVTPPATKRRRTRSPLKDSGSNKNLGTFDYDSQEKVIHVYAEEGWRVLVHSSSE